MVEPSIEQLEERIARAMRNSDIDAIGTDWTWEAYQSLARVAIIATYRFGLDNAAKVIGDFAERSAAGTFYVGPRP